MFLAKFEPFELDRLYSKFLPSRPFQQPVPFSNRHKTALASLSLSFFATAFGSNVSIFGHPKAHSQARALCAPRELTSPEVKIEKLPPTHPLSYSLRSNMSSVQVLILNRLL